MSFQRHDRKIKPKSTGKNPKDQRACKITRSFKTSDAESNAYLALQLVADQVQLLLPGFHRTARVLDRLPERQLRQHLLALQILAQTAYGRVGLLVEEASQLAPVGVGQRQQTIQLLVRPTEALATFFALAVDIAQTALEYLLDAHEQAFQPSDGMESEKTRNIIS